MLCRPCAHTPTSTHARTRRRLHLQRTLTFTTFHIESVGAMADLRGLDRAQGWVGGGEGAPLKFYGSYGVRTCLSSLHDKAICGGI